MTSSTRSPTSRCPKINVLSPDGQGQVVDNYRNYIQQVVDSQITAEEAADKTYADAEALFNK